MIKRLILLAGAFWLACAVAMAAPDDIKCSGVILGEDGEPIIGATVTVPGTKAVAVTDIDGRFVINAPAGKDIHVNYIGYSPLNLKAAANMGEVKMNSPAHVRPQLLFQLSTELLLTLSSVIRNFPKY